MAAAEFDFPAMGGSARVVVVGDRADLLVRARRQIEELEARWSRFLPESEISRLNRASGVPVIVSESTFTMISCAIEGWRRSAGRFDPTILSGIERLGYTRSFAHLTVVAEPAEAPAAALGCAGIVLDPIVRAVTLPPGRGFDPGGIGKGLAADFVTRDLLERGAAGALVSLGGDLRVGGEPPDGECWLIAIEHPDRQTDDIAHLEVVDGGVATSSRRSRRWNVGGREVHHLLDPRTGIPTDGAIAVTAVAADAWRAEVAAKAALVDDDAAETLRGLGCSGVVIDRDGSVREVVAA